MDIVEVLNKNPFILLAVFSVIVFPLGLLLLAYAAQKLGLVSLVKVMGDHVAAEVKIEGRLHELVDKMTQLVAANWDNRRYYDDKFDHFEGRLDQIVTTLDTIIKILPKRKED